jgi:hypothetical protein
MARLREFLARSALFPRVLLVRHRLGALLRTPVARIRTAASLLSCSALSACLAPAPPQQSVWPPDDYYLEVRLEQDGKERARARFWADGVAVLCEAREWLGGPEAGAAWFPVWSDVSAYRLRPKSIRDLARLLERAGLRTLAPDQALDVRASEQMVVFHWRAFGDTGIVWMAGPVGGAAVRVLHVVNAFLPEGHELAPAGMVGDTEPRHLVDVPEPVASLPQSLRFHRDFLLPRAPGEAAVLVDTFVLALAAGERDVARDMLDRLTELVGDDPTDAWWVLPGGEGAGLVAQLRRVLEGAEAQAPPAAERQERT